MHFNGKTIWGTRFGVPSTKLLVPKTILLLQTLQQWTCSLSLQTKPFKKLTYITERRTLLSTIENIDNNLLDLCEPVLIRTLLFGSNSFDTDANTNVLNATIEDIVSTKRFDKPLFQWKHKIFKQGYESVHSIFIAVVTCTICKFLFYFLGICFIPGYPYNFRYLVIVTFNFRVYDVKKL